jgi:chromosome segregation ATPase
VGEVVDERLAHQVETAAQSGHQAAAFVGFAQALHDESRRLLTLAEQAREHTRQLAEREAHLVDRELALLETERELEVRRNEVERGIRELRDLTSQAEAARARIAEAAEREAALNAVAHDLLARFAPQAG